MLVDCYSTRLDPSQVGIIDVNGVHNVSIHSFSGHIKFRNMTGGYIGASFRDGARLIIESTCVGGMIHVMGNVKVTNNAGSGCTVLTNYVTSPKSIWGYASRTLTSGGGGGGQPVGPGGILTDIFVRPNNVPIDGAAVWVSTDSAGSNVIAGTLYTNMFGHVAFMLDAGTYYMWRKKGGYDFPNPTVLTVTG